jgi:hypothetical protein
MLMRKWRCDVPGSNPLASASIAQSVRIPMKAAGDSD